MSERFPFQIVLPDWALDGELVKYNTSTNPSEAETRKILDDLQDRIIAARFTIYSESECKTIHGFSLLKGETKREAAARFLASARKWVRMTERRSKIFNT